MLEVWRRLGCGGHKGSPWRSGGHKGSPWRSGGHKGSPLEGSGAAKAEGLIRAANGANKERICAVGEGIWAVWVGLAGHGANTKGFLAVDPNLQTEPVVAAVCFVTRRAWRSRARWLATDGVESVISDVSVQGADVPFLRTVAVAPAAVRTHSNGAPGEPKVCTQETRHHLLALRGVPTHRGALVGDFAQTDPVPALVVGGEASLTGIAQRVSIHQRIDAPRAHLVSKTNFAAYTGRLGAVTVAGAGDIR